MRFFTMNKTGNRPNLEDHKEHEAKIKAAREELRERQREQGR
jgi:hypothetical protein